MPKKTEDRIVVYRDYGDGYPDGVIIHGIYGKLSINDIQDIQEMLNGEYGISMPLDPSVPVNEHGSVGAKCYVWWEPGDDESPTGWMFEIYGYVLDNRLGDEVVVYKTLDEYIRSQIDAWERANPYTMLPEPFALMRVVDSNIKVELDMSDLHYHTYLGIEFVTYHSVQPNDGTIVSAERMSGCSLQTTHAPDRERAVAWFHDDVDKLGVMYVHQKVSNAMEECKDADIVTVEEYRSMKV